MAPKLRPSADAVDPHETFDLASWHRTQFGMLATGLSPARTVDLFLGEERTPTQRSTIAKVA
ncbi:MAG TPA: hypothetical protein VM848_12005 [Acidimicrobiia bacterium]|nr:hypothetical protein [Acidimicrobiia bacterium]